MLAYLITSIIYLLVSPLLGTPFNNELKLYPKLMKIKKDSSRSRSFLFIGGVFGRENECDLFFDSNLSFDFYLFLSGTEGKGEV